MARVAKVVVPNLFRHITPRDNYRQNLIFCKKNLEAYKVNSGAADLFIDLTNVPNVVHLPY